MPWKHYKSRVMGITRSNKYFPLGLGPNVEIKFCLKKKVLTVKINSDSNK